MYLTVLTNLMWLKNHTFVFKIALKCNLSALVPVNSFILVVLLHLVRNTRKEQMYYWSWWVMHIVFNWLHHRVSAPVSDKRSSTSCNERKSAVQSNLIYSQEAGHHDWGTMAITQTCCKLTSAKKENTVNVCRCLICFFKCHRGQDVCIYKTRTSGPLHTKMLCLQSASYSFQQCNTKS